MKRFLSIVAAVMLVLGVAGNAMAYFEAGDIQLVAYEGDPSVPSGYEVHYDLDMGKDVATGFTLTTSITLADFDASSWDDIQVGIYGGGDLDMITWAQAPALFASDGDITGLLPSGYTQFTSAVVASNYMTTEQKVRETKADGPYIADMDKDGGTTTGSYATMVSATTDFQAEAELVAGGTVTGFDLYSWTGTAGDDAILLGTFTLDTTGTNLVVSYSTGSAPTVPIPGAFILLASGLLGLIGIRRRS